MSPAVAGFVTRMLGETLTKPLHSGINAGLLFVIECSQGYNWNCLPQGPVLHALNQNFCRLLPLRVRVTSIPFLMGIS